MHGAAKEIASGSERTFELHRSGMRSGGVASQESGAALVVLLTLLLLVGASMLLDRSGSVVTSRTERGVATTTNLAEAKAALLAWGVTRHAGRGKHFAPGQLPFPDRNRDGNYDGMGDCVTFGLNDSHLLGRLPWAGAAPPCPGYAFGLGASDAHGERLWYALSRNLVAGGGGGPVNPDMDEPRRAAHPWIALRDAKGNVITEPGNGRPLAVAAVIIAPGPALSNQDRSGAAPEPENYLDRITIGSVTFDNSDADGCPDAVTAPCEFLSQGEEFILHPGTLAGHGFNDLLVYITVDELTRALEKRVLGEVAIGLNRYRAEQGVYPWLSSFRDPKSADFKSDLSRHGLLPVHLPDEIFSTRFGATWRLDDATPTSGSRNSGNPALTPSLDDVRSGQIQVTPLDGRCVWSDPTRADCMGLHIDPEYFRSDLGMSVERTVEVVFSVLDHAPRVTSPTSADVRRRSLAMSGSRLPGISSILAAPGWSVRITDNDGTDWGQRDFRIDSNTAGAITLRGIRFELSIVYDDIQDARDELPEWIVENDWHHFVYVAFSGDAAPGGDVDGDGDCATPVESCLKLSVGGNVVRSDIRALVVSSGSPGPNQNRVVGDCDGDGLFDDFRCAYFEEENGDTSTPLLADSFSRNRFDIGFNDQVRVIEPPPP